MQNKYRHKMKNVLNESNPQSGHFFRRVVYFFFSLWDNALPATLFEASLYLPSLRIFDAFVATCFEVTFYAIGYPPF